MQKRKLLLGLLVASVVGHLLGDSSLIGQPAESISQAQPPRAVQSCDSLASLTLPNATITLAQVVSAGAPITTPTPGGVTQPIRASRELCRVAATLRPSSDSDIKIEVWMPATNWNQKLQAVGNGAFNGTIAYAAMIAAIERDYATASTDTGHVGNTAGFALGRPEKVIDFGWRAVHEMTLTSKRIIAAYYQAGPRFSYWNGCSAGGRQAMKEAQRFPNDFDGIIAGAPGLDWTGRAAQAMRVLSVLETNEAARLTQRQRQLLHGAVVAACDGIDGVKDGLIENPQRCKFDPAALQCRGADDAGCLTARQVDTARLIYSTAITPNTKRAVNGQIGRASCRERVYVLV